MEIKQYNNLTYNTLVEFLPLQLAIYENGKKTFVASHIQVMKTSPFVDFILPICPFLSTKQEPCTVLILIFHPINPSKPKY